MIASFFDIDGTLTAKNRYLLLDFCRYMAQKNIFPMERYARLIEELKKVNTGEEDGYRKFAFFLADTYSKGLEGVDFRKVEREGRNFIAEVLDSYLYPYSKELVALMKKRGFTVAISGVSMEMADPISKALGFDFFFSTEIERKNGTFTGILKKNMILKEIKEAALDSFVKERAIDMKKSFAFGDTFQDVSMLSKVGNPVAMNPDNDLLKVAVSRGWKVLRAGDNVIEIISRII